jgi:hypothetical protein
MSKSSATEQGIPNDSVIPCTGSCVWWSYDGETWQSQDFCVGGGCHCLEPDSDPEPEAIAVTLCTSQSDTQNGTLWKGRVLSLRPDNIPKHWVVCTLTEVDETGLNWKYYGAGQFDFDKNFLRDAFQKVSNLLGTTLIFEVMENGGVGELVAIGRIARATRILAVEK